MSFYRKLLIALFILAGGIVLFQPKEIREDSPPEIEDVTHLSSSSRILSDDEVSVGPYVSKKGAGARVTFPF